MLWIVSLLKGSEFLKMSKRALLKHPATRSNGQEPRDKARCQPPLLIFTDLDGTLLNHDSYSWTEAQPALDLCRARSIPVILVSSKTRAEMNPLRLKLGLVYPFVAENGGGIFFPAEESQAPPAGATRSEGLWKLSLGAAYDHVLKALREIEKELDLPIRSFSQMSLEEISSLTALDLDTAHLSAMREYDEPFLIRREGRVDLSLLKDAAKKRGLRITAGGRFYHLHGNTDKGMAIEIIVSWYKASHPHVVTIGLGDSPNDFDMLRKVDYPFLVQSPRSFPGIEDEIPRLNVTKAKGPAGWNEAVLDILSRKSTGGFLRYV
jgi:mannosyl-3-phosphoglycerate phosphatase